MSNHNKTAVLAIGNAGGNILESICMQKKNTSLEEICYVFVDSDENDLCRHKVDSCKNILIDKVDEVFPNDILCGVEKLVIVAGLGGQTATKFTELAIKTAKDAGVNTINVVVTLQFIFEGEIRVKLAKEAVQRLSEIEDVEIVIFNTEDLIVKYPDLNFFNAFETVDKEIKQVIKNIM